MTALVVVAHPDTTSFTQRLARSVADRLTEDAVSTAVADLHAEGFDPRFSLEDRAGYPAGGTPPADVLAEQRRLDGVDDLVLVFPVYWWSMPALLKGWVDRVFTDGWAFDTGVTPTGRRLDHLTVHLAMVAGEDAEGFAKRGYDTALSTQIITGILGYTGARTGHTGIVHDAETRSRDSLAREARAIVDGVAARVRSSAAEASGARA
ncbi:NAD(P)H-dependent oxidoreductase [Rhodococcus sp. BP-149]|uniref:NAD(P)H-dependent oxidoreductase n=1 Tax=unclassified Rhodococcus (in: high G+C Gram-positive bacteria) TaxID=192944 RepID=UPI0006F6B781|nr:MULTISPECIES: NAD(P)H-dependent oxidoreductase [unclassified Rhodococcus (in: high G+C Gram-positive bacteria)]KQU29460.1 NAD(P)H dehydrogenase [Rhodococcus sp. Leaf225]KQU41078.1 NAD(P)H dehydrogenase [Rhodococcus sp. Leaf258]MBY6676335.1 NAD(P)H-dependent oxidoreductase [Rhodococcus sp. BP-332]MBY6686203.1 NAD(P)H-dependent oxidoreductase [Rhodococcus sp. BP-288]MBY6693708.1 NAD(P)H-dependent oxidoreductase [Rhodococcus sp. BP-188]